MKLFKQFQVWATGSDLLAQLQKSRIRLAILTALMLAIFLAIHIIVVVNITFEFYGASSPFSNSNIDEIPIRGRLIGATIVFWFFLTSIVWFVLYKILKPVSDTIKAKEIFVANAHHELKTPLTIIKSELDLFYINNLSQQQKQDLIGINFQVQKMSSLVTTMLSNLDKNKEIELQSTVNLREIINESVKILSTVYKSSKLKIEHDIGLDQKLVVNDIIFKQLILSIIENAFKHTTQLEKCMLSIRNEDDSIIFINTTDKNLFKVGNGYNSIAYMAKKSGYKIGTLIEENKFKVILTKDKYS
jgi:signal transduction histidine kinase